MKEILLCNCILLKKWLRWYIWQIYVSGFTKFEITVACGLEFHWYLRTLSLKFQKARTKIEVFLSLPCWLSQFTSFLFNTIKWPILIYSQFLLRSSTDVKKVLIFKFQRIATIRGLGNIMLSRLKRERLRSLAKHVIIIRIFYKEIVKPKIVFQWAKILRYQCKKVKKIPNLPLPFTYFWN